MIDNGTPFSAYEGCFFLLSVRGSDLLQKISISGIFISHLSFANLFSFFARHSLVFTGDVRMVAARV